MQAVRCVMTKAQKHCKCYRQRYVIPIRRKLEAKLSKKIILLCTKIVKIVVVLVVVVGQVADDNRKIRYLSIHPIPSGYHPVTKQI